MPTGLGTQEEGSGCRVHPVDPWEKDPQGSKMSCQDIGGGGGSVLGQGQALGVPAEREALARAGADASVEEGRVPLESPPTLPPTLCGPRTPIQWLPSHVLGPALLEEQLPSSCSGSGSGPCKAMSSSWPGARGPTACRVWQEAAGQTPPTSTLLCCSQEGLPEPLGTVPLSRFPCRLAGPGTLLLPCHARWTLLVAWVGPTEACPAPALRATLMTRPGHRQRSALGLPQPPPLPVEKCQ